MTLTVLTFTVQCLAHLRSAFVNVFVLKCTMVCSTSHIFFESMVSILSLILSLYSNLAALIILLIV